MGCPSTAVPVTWLGVLSPREGAAGAGHECGCLCTSVPPWITCDNCAFAHCFECAGALGGVRVAEERRWAPLASVVQGAVPASSSARLLHAVPRVGSSEAGMRSQRERCRATAAIQLFAAGDPAHAGAAPYVICQLTRVVRNLPRSEKEWRTGLQPFFSIGNKKQ